MTDQTPSFREWMILELMGHRRLAGLVTEQTIAGAAFLRVDIMPEGREPFTQYYSPQAVYCLTPTTEAIARAVGANTLPEPAFHWELPEPRRELAPDVQEGADADDDDELGF